MRYLIDILHPAHVHFFHHFIVEAEKAGHEVFITARKKEMATELLEAYGHPHRVISTMAKKKLDLVWELLLRNRALEECAREFRPDAMMGIMGISIAAVGRKLGIPSYVFYDTENATVSNLITFPRATEVITPRCYSKKVRGNHVTYSGNHELAYLHPKRFTPDPEIRKALGLRDDEGFALVRFVSWGASHDFFQRGFTLEGKRRLIESLQKRMRVFVSSEGPLPEDLQSLRLPIPPVLVHHVIAQASLLVGESATMASEAAVLGTPAVFCSPVGRGYTDEEEKRFGLVWNVKKEEDALRAVDQILAIGPDAASLRREFQRRRSHLIRESVDVTGWILDHMGAGTSGAACGLGELQPAFAASEESEFAPASRAGISPA